MFSSQPALPAILSKQKAYANPLLGAKFFPLRHTLCNCINTTIFLFREPPPEGSQDKGNMSRTLYNYFADDWTQTLDCCLFHGEAMLIHCVYTKTKEDIVLFTRTRNSQHICVSIGCPA